MYFLLYSRDTCNANNVTMCPTCDFNCDYFTLSDNCLYAKIIHLFDNDLNVVFALLMAVWGKPLLSLPIKRYIFSFLFKLQLPLFWKCGKDTTRC